MGTQKGQSLVEVAISATILLLLLSMMAELGVMLFQYIQLRDAAQEGALYGSICGCNHSCTLDDIAVRVRGQSDSPINLMSPEVHVMVGIKDSLGNDESLVSMKDGDAMEVHVQYNHHVFMPFLSKALGQDFLLDASVTDTVLCSAQSHE